MPQELNIPNLKDLIKDLEKLHDVTKLTALEFLNVAINGEKATKAAGGASLKDNVNQQKVAAQTSDELAKKEAKLIELQTEKAKQIASLNLAIQQQNAVNKAQAQTIELTDAAIKKEASSIADARAQIALLTQARNNVNLTTEDGKAKLILLNDALDKNNAFIKQNADGTLKQKMNIGAYSEGVQNALEKTGLFNGKLGELSRTAIGFVQGGAQAVQKIKDVNDSVITGAKNLAGYTVAKLGFTTAEQKGVVVTEEAIIATKQESLATDQAKVAKIGFTQTTKTATDVTTQSIAATEGMAVAEEGAATATGVLDVALGILLSPITLVVAAVAALIYIFKDFAPLVNPIKDAFAAMGAVMGVIKQDIFDLVTGARSLGDIFSKFGDDTSKAAKGAMELAKASRDLAKAQEIQEVAAAQAATKVQDLILQSKNRTLSEKERVALIEEAQRIEKQSFAVTEKNNNEAIRISREKLFEGKKLNDQEKKAIDENDFAKIRSLKISKNLDADELAAYQKLLIEKQSLLQQDQQIREKAQNRKDQLEDKAEAKAQKEAEDAQKRNEEAAKKKLEAEKKSAELSISTMKLTLDNQIATYDASGKLDDENIAHLEAISSMKVQIANAEMQKNLIGVAKGSQDEKAIQQANKEAVTKIYQERSNALKSIEQQQEDWRLELYNLNNKTLLDGSKELTDLLVAEENRRLQNTLNVEKQAMREKLKIDKELSDERLKEMAKNNQALTESQQKYYKFIVVEDEKTDKQIKKNDTDLLNAKIKVIEEEESMQLRKYKLQGEGSFKTQVYEFKLIDDKLKKERAVLVESLKNDKLDEKTKAETNKKIEDIDIKTSENKMSLDNLVSANKMESLTTGLNALINITGKESEIGKRASEAQVLINTYEGASKEIAKGGLLGYATGAIIIADGIATIAKIEGIKAFETGTDYAPYTGIAMIDEAGAEIHTDRLGNIKSLGSDRGARFTNITQGDRIIPADTSAIIKQMMYASYGMSANDIKAIDYNEIGKQFDKSAGRIVNAIKSKPNAQLSVMVAKNSDARVNFRGTNR